MIDKLNKAGDSDGQHDDDDSDGGAAGSTGKGGKGGGTDSSQDFESWIPGFNDYLQAPEDQKNLRELSEQITLEQRLAAKALGINVHALNKAQQLKAQQRGDYNHDGIDDPTDNSNSSGFDEHPELAHQDGMIDPSIVLPANEAKARNGQELANKLKNKLAFTPKAQPTQEYKPAPEPRYRMRAAPKPPRPQ
jgi:hypothetical protein